MDTKIIIFFFSANPLDTEKLSLGREFRNIEEARKDSQNKNKFTVLREVATTIDDLQREILENKPRIVHFCGHGLGNQGLVLETKSGLKQPVSAQSLGGLFALLADRVECVILNACYTKPQAAVIGQHINYVIGTINAIRDDAAIAFSKGFYTGYFSGESIERAYEFGKNRIQQEIYNPNNQKRKLVPVDTEKGNLPEDEVFTFLIKETLSKIISEEIESIKIENIPSNLKKIGSTHFVGREKQLEELHQLLQQNEQVTISAIAGMGGIGKTELALQYALTYKDHYPGSLCWFSVRGENIETQIIEYAASYLNLFAPEELETNIAKLKYCWQNWRSEKSLIVLDDVPNYGKFYRENIEPYLPTATSNIKVLMTSRERPGANISRIDLDVLSETKALELLTALIGQSRIKAEPETAKDVCKWLGYLPLGLELVGRYISLDENLTIERTLQRLEKRKLKARALADPEQADMTSQLGVAAAFDLSWEVLSSEAKKIGCYLSLFDSGLFKWSWVEDAWIEPSDEDERELQIEDLEELRNLELSKRSLLKAVPGSKAYQLHSLIAQYFRAKLEEQEQVTELKQKFCGVMIEIARSISQTPTEEKIKEVSIAIPHLSLVARELTEYIEDESLIWSFVSLGWFYQGQGIYNQAEQWFKQSLIICRDRLGEKHPDVAISLVNLAKLHVYQGRYEEAEHLLLQSLELYQKLPENLAIENIHIYLSIIDGLIGTYQFQSKYKEAENLLMKFSKQLQQFPKEQSLNFLHSIPILNTSALLSYKQGRYKEAESIYLQALKFEEQLLEQQSPLVATIWDNLALLYKDQGRYEEAEPLLLRALKVRKLLLDKQHPDVARSLNNLALLYKDQEKYEKAEPLFIEALELFRNKFGNKCPDVATCLNNLALLYKDQRRYEEAESLYIEALELREQLLGDQHSDVAISLNNLADLYSDQGRYEEAEHLLFRALEIRKELFDEEHPDMVNNFTSMALICYEKGSYEEAIRLFSHALKISKKVFGENHPNSIIIRKGIRMIEKIQNP